MINFDSDLEPTAKIFVYGTLKRGYGNNRLLAGSRFLGEAVTVRAWRLRTVGFPVMMRPSSAAEPEAGWVRGEVYIVDESTLKRLDQLESEGRMYRRQGIQVTMASGKIHTVWAYVGIGRYWSRCCAPLVRQRNGILIWTRGGDDAEDSSGELDLSVSIPVPTRSWQDY